MKSRSIIVGLSVLALWLGGCVVFVDERAADSTDATIAEIDAVGELSFGSERKGAYEAIAAREGLAARAQVHLVEAVLNNLEHDSAKEAVLLKLVGNPDFSKAAERAIRESVDKLAFESSRQSVLKAMSDRDN